MACLIYQVLHIKRGERRQEPPDPQDATLLASMMQEVLIREAVTLRGQQVRVKGGRALLRFEEFDDADAYLRFLLEFEQEVEQKGAGYSVESLAFILESGMELISDTENKAFQRLSRLLRDHHGIFARGRITLPCFDLGERITDDEELGVFALLRREKRRTVAEDTDSSTSILPKVARLLIGIITIGVAVGGLSLVTPRVYEWLRNTEVRELYSRRMSMGPEALYSRLVTMNTWRESEQLETILARWVRLSIVDCARSTQSMELLQQLRERFGFSETLNRSYRFLSQLRSGNQVSTQFLRAWPSDFYDLLMQAYLVAERDPYPLLSLTPDMQATDSWFQKGFIRTLQSPSKGREAYLLKLCRKRANRCVFLKPLVENSSVVIRRKALKILIGVRQADIEVLRGFLNQQIQSEALSAADLSMLGTIGKTHPAASNLVTSLEKVRQVLRRRDLQADLGPRLEAVIASLRS